MKTAIKTVTASDVTLPLDKYPHIEFGVTLAAVTPHTCMMCGTTDLGLRAKTCGANCRKAASRRKERLGRELNNVQNALDTLQRYSSMWPDLALDIEATLKECVTTATVTYFAVTAGSVTE